MSGGHGEVSSAGPLKGRAVSPPWEGQPWLEAVGNRLVPTWVLGRGKEGSPGLLINAWHSEPSSHPSL